MKLFKELVIFGNINRRNREFIDFLFNFIFYKKRGIKYFGYFLSKLLGLQTCKCSCVYFLL